MTPTFRNERKKANELDIEAYLRRVGYHGSRTPTAEVLRNLHRHHLLSVPFENLDIHLGREILLDQRLFYKKIVDERRGGYCYELNGCFALLLRKLGFRVSMLSARVARKNGSFSPEFDHMTLLVHLKDRWLADVGFGDSFTEPKRIDDNHSQEDDGYFYQVARKNKTRILARKRENGSWEPQYSFTLRARRLADFAARNRYQQTSSRSHFTQGRLISQMTRSGRVTLTDKKLIKILGWRRVVQNLKNTEEFDELLIKNFRLRVRGIPCISNR
jgi:N-hydroxyarylamine O-acetyltransferase